MKQRENILAVMAVVLYLAAASDIEAGKYNAVLSIGDQAPAWKELPGVDGGNHSLKDQKEKELVVLFFHSCSCDVAEEYEERIKILVSKYGGPKGRVVFVAINVSKDEEDRMPAMKKRAESHKFNFSYLFDESQEIARQYGALWTPEVFVLDRERKVAYMGGIDDTSAGEFVKHRYLDDAIASLLASRIPATQETPAIGCRIRLERKRRSPPTENPPSATP